MKRVYLKLKPEYENINMYKYMVYGHTEEKLINNICFLKTSYYRRPIGWRYTDDEYYDVITEEEFKLEVL